MEAAAIAAYHNQTEFPVVQVLLSDDAPQFKQLTGEQALCWVHDGRNYKKLEPIVSLYKKDLKISEVDIGIITGTSTIQDVYQEKAEKLSDDLMCCFYEN